LIGSTGRFHRLRPLLIGTFAAAAFLVSQAPAPAAAAEPAPTISAATAIVRAAESHIGAHYQRGAAGPTRFDCSGLVYRVFSDLGLGSRIGYLRSASGLYRYFARRGLASRTNPQLGDLVIWGGGIHVGIYVGHGRAISALADGVRIAPVSSVLSGFTAYLHTRLASLRIPTPGYKAPIVPHALPPAAPKQRTEAVPAP
jgi:cell wall-associated NlpC family hydrolase